MGIIACIGTRGTRGSVPQLMQHASVLPAYPSGVLYFFSAGSVLNCPSVVRWALMAGLPLRRLVNATDIVDMEWKGKRFNISLKKKEALKAAEPVMVSKEKQHSIGFRT